ncbi:MAG TPA: ATP-binding protein, partial [Bryobacteraceae bacterium]|nr:ATP-binding protein [Bryobacteraceae bacterium]
AEAKHLALALDVAEEVPEWLEGDPDRLRQVLLNLMSNAVKFTESGKVRCSVQVESRDAVSATLRFSVADTGIGIPAAKQKIIFEPFRQVDASTTRKHGGTGLGLAISARLVELMGGRIWLVSEPGAGSAFHFTAHFRIIQKVHAVKPAQSPISPGVGKQRRVLLAEDNPVNQRVASKLLSKYGFDVTVVSNGREALQAVTDAEDQFDIILMDVQMPEMDGLEAAAAIREAERKTLEHTPIIALTAHAMAGDRDRCLAAGMDGYVSKPIQFEDLLEAMRKLEPAGAERD